MIGWERYRILHVPAWPWNGAKERKLKRTQAGAADAGVCSYPHELSDCLYCLCCLCCQLPRGRKYETLRSANEAQNA
jgi:hypothetical protein